MEDTKPLWASKTVIGAVIAGAAVVAPMIGYQISDTNGLTEQVTALLGILFAIYGRVTACKKVG